ncbi:MAG: flagellar biosynthesis regulator FlaF [Alphaproteobacteria bacterium]|nr:flagellar biosynthesis regulator FlaF [Alphaproteobacteria bacterium]
MQNQALNAYNKVSKQTATPRQLESSLLAKSAAHFQRIRDNWDDAQADLEAAMLFNRRLWTVFMTSVTRDDNPLPKQIRQNVANLGLFIMNRQLELLRNPEARKLDALININRELAAGLRAMAPPGGDAG